MSDRIAGTQLQPGTADAKDKPTNPVADQNKSVPVNNDAPITNETVPADLRTKKLHKKDQGPNPLKFKVWLGGHAATIVFGTISLAFQLLRLPNKWYINSICYRLALLGAIASLAMTTSRRFGLKFLPPMGALLAYQNFQYVILAVVWFFTFKSTFKLLPYYILAILHLANHQNLLVVTKHSKALAGVIAYDELFLIFYLLLRTFCFRNASGFQLLAFFVFYWLRILFNKETTTLFSTLVDKIDFLVKDVENPKFKKVWTRSKMMIKERQQEGL